MPVIQYLYDDASAPTLTGETGSVIALLDACLVDGYGAKADSGWSKPYSGTNVAVYRNNPSAQGSTGMYFKVDDTNAEYSIISAFKSMSDINTGTDEIPSGTPAYSNPTIYWPKSSDASSTPRMWNIIADDRTFYINWCPQGNTATGDMGTYAYIGGAGDFESYVPGNTYNYFIAGATDQYYYASNTSILDEGSTYAAAIMGRSQELTLNKQSKFHVSYMGHNGASGSATHHPYSVYTGLKFFYPAYVQESATQNNITGHLRGTYAIAGIFTYLWNENYGKLPADPSGPDMVQMITHVNNWGSLYIRLGSW